MRNQFNSCVLQGGICMVLTATRTRGLSQVRGVCHRERDMGRTFDGVGRVKCRGRKTDRDERAWRTDGGSAPNLGIQADSGRMAPGKCWTTPVLQC